MTKKGAKELVLHLAKYFPKQFPPRLEREDVEERAQGYYDVLTEYDNATIMEAANRLLKTMSFLPTIAELREAADGILAEQQKQAPVNEFTDEDGYRYKRQNGQMVCVYRPNRTPLKDPALQAFMDEKRRIYAEVGAPHSYTMRQVRELAKQKHIEIPVQDDMKEFMEILGRK